MFVYTQRFLDRFCPKCTSCGLCIYLTTDTKRKEALQGFPGVLIVVGHFLDSFLWELNFLRWQLDSMSSYLKIPIGYVQ